MESEDIAQRKAPYFVLCICFFSLHLRACILLKHSISGERAMSSILPPVANIQAPTPSAVPGPFHLTEAVSVVILGYTGSRQARKLYSAVESTFSRTKLSKSKHHSACSSPRIPYLFHMDELKSDDFTILTTSPPLSFHDNKLDLLGVPVSGQVYEEKAQHIISQGRSIYV